MENVNYLIKDGQATEIPLSCLINATLSRDVGSFEHPDIKYLYEKYLDKGCSIIGHIPYLQYRNSTGRGMDILSLHIMIANKVNPKDEKVITDIINKEVQNIRQLAELYNFREHDYDYFAIGSSTRKILQILPVLFHEKLGTLSLLEQTIMRQYRTFSLEELLYQGRFVNNDISNNNCGVIVIFPDCVIKRTNTKQSHDREIASIMEASHYPDDISRIEIRIYPYSLYIVLPSIDKLNKYQRKMFYNFVEGVKILAIKYEDKEILSIDVGEKLDDVIYPNINPLITCDYQKEDLIKLSTLADSLVSHKRKYKRRIY